MKAVLGIAARYVTVSEAEAVTFVDVVEEISVPAELVASPQGVGVLGPDLVFVAIMQREQAETDAAYQGYFWIDAPNEEKVRDNPLNLAFGDGPKCRIVARFNGLPYYGLGEYRLNVECAGAVASWTIRVRQEAA